ncbi:cadherin-related tumor suppressor isoform X2 [Hyposmocoma kahamanoa]|uniref:cadherin-related tumor suppressor isoform X2 n=1 Tax=Hyposmocoma kahamanoa TaxID=1477025 RepID=UPI000E6D6BEB|nr:cadherin-related tumor suppressor isoform X2 [Hyposmocoma kahamanoa]
MTRMGRWHVTLITLAVLVSAGAAATEQMQSRAVDTGVDLRVPEEQPAGTIVGRIPTKPGFTYRFNEPPKEFVLDPVTGEIRTNMVLDRETSDRYAFVVLSSQPTYPIEVRLRVTDVNDNYPEFPEPSIAVAFSESAAAGTKLLLDAATDKDLLVNGITNDYRIVDGDNEGKFRLNVTVNPSGQTSYLHLETTGKLDRETTDFYILNISARDGGTPPKYGYLQVNVSILDVNDNPPIFDQSDFSVSLNESVPPGTTVLKVTATDSDLGDNGKITYEVTDTEKQFAVDPESGVITTTKKLNCPKYCSNMTCNMTCVLTVIAKDHGVPRQDARTYVTVNLIDANDHDPVITFTYVPSTANFATVDENAKNGSLVAAITVTDLDAGLNGITSVSIVTGNELNHFRLENSSSVYIVYVNGILDREEISKYNLTVVATDKGTPARTATSFLVIHVNDVNDHEPVFEKSEYSAILSELAPSGTYVASITATDEDTGVNAEIFYDFYDGNQQQWFFIDHLTGLVTTRAVLDREIQGTVELNVSARDGGPNPKWAYTRLKITILDENDEAPTFPQNTINATLHENIKPIKEILILTASDYDQGANGSVSYYLPSSIERKYPNTFILDPITGQLSTVIELDRERVSLYEIQVLAKDQGFPPQSSTATIFLKVLDVNDNDPVFYPRRYIESISDDHPIGTNILQVKAFDEDEGENARIIYKLESGGDGYFDVESWTGNIILHKDLRKASNTLFTLKISCKDKGNRKTMEDAIVEIVKMSQRRNLEFDNYNGYTFKIIEDEGNSKSHIGRPVGKVSARIASDSLSYYILEGDLKNVFKIDEQTGIITTNSNIDREDKMTYHLKIMAKSGITFGFTTVNISVLDVNDNYPIFIEDKDEIHIPENMAVGQEVYFARATDRDSGSNRTIFYTLSYNPENIFRISDTTGVIYLNKPISNEPGSVVSMEVTATDNGSPALAAKHVIAAIIDDVNDHTPVFDHTSYETSLLESTLVNTRFFAISASDADLEASGTVSYTIAEGNTDGKFGVFPDGFLYVKSPLDREERDYYSLTIVATDHGKPPRSSQVPVVIHVLDENDNSPQFTNTTFIFKIKENEPPDTFVGKLVATDRDIGRNAELTFSLPAAQNDFRIDSKNGFIKTLKSFDRENLAHNLGQNYITLTVTVSDNGKMKLTDSVRVTIYVTDVNDNAPVFKRLPYKVEVSEGTAIGASIMRVYSTDADEGLNGDIYYKLIKGDDFGHFSLDEATGQLIIAKPLDRETVDRYQLTVVAHDSGQSVRLSSTATITVDVLDENDNPPIFTNTQLNVSVLETEPVNKKIIQFHATDADLGINRELQFSITSGNRKEAFFIDSYSGELFLHKQLDYEDLTTYVLNVVATDNGSPSLSSSISFIVNVIDANDNAPVFTNTAIVRQIREGIPKHTPIVTVTAEDPDSGLNGKVYYSITHQEPNDGRRHFAINNVTGVIHTLLPIDRESIDTFRITVVAYDRAEPLSARLSAEKLVTVIVEDINDNAPVFVSMNAAVFNFERTGRSTGRGIYIMNVLARDLDSGTNGLVTYKLIHGGNDLFDLHRSNGALTLRYPPAMPEARWNLVIKATDEAVLSEQRSTETYLTVIMGGSELMGVTWTNVGSVSVAENAPAGTAVLNLTNTYKSGLEYYIVNVTGDGKQVDRLFDIDSSLGILSTAVSLDREAGVDKYEVKICAVSSGSHLQLTTTKVEVIILDKNDSPPEFKNIPQAYHASEDLAPGQVIATVSAEDPDTIGTITYSIQSEEPTPFSLDSRTGTLSLKDPLDRETTAEYRVIIRADDGMQYTDVTVVVQVTDTNDNPPVFKETAYSFDIPENAARGSVVGAVSAIDLDSETNAQLTYTVISDWANDVFSLNPQTGVFTLTARLDYEETQHYILVAQAQDSGHPSLSGTVTVYVNIIDLNDNAPVFDPMSFSNEILEDVIIGSSVVTISATDMDSGLNGKLHYSITSGDENQDFAIADNGTIYTAKHLDRETLPLYNLIVTARDSAKPPEPQLSSTVQVTIQLKDVNDMAPEFITPNITTVSENIPLNTVVMTIKAVDKDEGRNGYIEYFMAPDPEVNGYFSLGNVDGILRASGKLDRELKSSYTIIVTAKDRGDPPNVTKTKVTINILDENDNSPVFDPKQYSASVPENASIGASVLQVSATDIDEGTNGRVRYSIASGDENRDFSISEDTGVVRVAKNLNFERKSRYVLTIRAEDCAKDDVRFDTAELSISIQDMNDNPPTFLDSPYLAYVMENVIPPNGGYIITIHAYDADSPPFNNQVRYFIKEGDADLFKINASSGQISLLRTLDREAQDEYTLALVAMDTGSPPLTGSGTVKIVVQDVNDNSPEYERQSYKANVKENLPPGTIILYPKATDKDIGNNAKIRYSLLGDKSERFQIDSASGVISTNATLDREEWNIYYLIIMAQDSSTTDPRTATANLTIVVEDENDNTPNFAQPVYEAYISERTVIGDFVFGARAKDSDIGLNSKIIYDLKGEHQELFSINRETGVIKAKENLIKYKQNGSSSFNLIIVATDSGLSPRQSTAELILIPKSVKNFPRFTVTNKLTFTFSEDTPEGVLVTRLSATSPKKGPTGLLQYAIAGGNVGDALRIESMSGEIFITGKGLDYETMPLYEVWFEVRDSDNPPLKSFIEIEIKVTDANDNAPIIENALYNATVLEEESPPQLVIKINAHDEDSNENGRISYRLVNDYEETFVIDSESGEIYTNLALDRESIPFYEILVEAFDHGDPQLVGTSTVIVTVLDKNDNPPRFTRLFSVNVTENAEIGSFVIKVTSSDLDTGPNANATYSFVENPGEKFVIDPVSGNVTVARPLDRELQDEYILKVAAIDGAWRSETPLTITIQDQNDNAPEFEYSYYSFNFPELQKKNSFVGQVIATDRDKQGPNSIISYSLQQSSDLFSADPATGEILSKFMMKYKRTSVNSSPLVKHDFLCQCADGFMGNKCERRQDPCSPNPCRFGGQCRKQGHDFVCICSVRREGKTCELERDDVCSSNPCKNGGSCKESSDRNSFFCLCRPGYRGNQCEALVDSCRPNPCMHGGICISLKPGYKCSCTNGRYGIHCESSTFGFNELSFLQFPPLDPSTNDITIIFATTKPDALLLYNFGAQTGGRSDFIAIELLGGKPVFSFGGARTSITSIAITDNSKNLADGNWYKLTATRNGRVISLSITSCTDRGDVCTECEPGDSSCYNDGTGQAGTLNFNNEPLLIGGLHKADPVLERPGQIHSDDFVGCMHSITINGRLLNLTTPIRARGVDPNCDRSEKGACYKKDTCGAGECLDRWKSNFCKCDENLISPDCSASLLAISVSENAFVFYTISEKHRRMQLLESFYGGNTGWEKKTNKLAIKTVSKSNGPAKTLSFSFRTRRKDGLVFYAATDKYYTLIELQGGKVSYTSKQNSIVNMTQTEQDDVSDGNWHKVTLFSLGRSIRLMVDNKNVGEELDTAGVHDFLDPYLTTIAFGGVKSEWLPGSSHNKFEGCLANFSINSEVQPFSGNGSIFREATRIGKIISGCHNAFGVGMAQNPDPLSIGITLVIVFFIILIVAILVSFVVFRLRKQKKEKGNGSTNKTGIMPSKQNGGPAMLNAPNLIAGTNDTLIGRSLHSNETNLNSYMSDNADIMRNVGHIVGPELLSKKYKDREIMNIDPPRPQRPDIIEREVVGKSPALREDHHPPPPPSTNTSHHTHDHPSGMDLNSEVPEHYDLENASSIAPSDIDIVYHYKGFREAGGVRKYKATPPPIAGYHHKHQTPPHRHSPHHPSGYPPRVLPQASQPPPQPRQHQTTPLARLSPSSELSQQPRILTLHDISGKPLQSALLATTSSSGGVGKDALHSNSERSLNSPVMSQLSGQSSSAGRKTPSAPPQVPQVVSVGTGAVGLTAEEIERMNARQRTSSLVSTLDAVSSSSEAPRGVGVGHHMSHRHHSPPVDHRSSSGSDDESGNDSFTCSEIEYDNNSISADKPEDVRRQNVSSGSNTKKPILPPPYESFDSSFRGSLSTLVASDDDLAPHVGSALYRQANGSPAPATLGWDYLLNWGPNFESMIGVFKDIAELPDSVNGRMSSSLRLPNGTPKPSEEYV